MQKLQKRTIAPAVGAEATEERPRGRSRRPLSVARRLAGVLAAVAVLASSSAAHATHELIAFPPVDVARMALYIDTTLSSITPNGVATAGYAYAIAKDGKLATQSAPRGWARQPYEGAIPMDPNRRLDVWSVTKNLTAAATLKLLEKGGLSVDSGVDRWLPSSWTRGEGWDQLTFRHLLSHTSGIEQMSLTLTQQELQSYGTLWSGLQFAVTRDIVPGSDFAYTNMNYALLRIVIPVLWRQFDPGANVPALTSANSGTITLRYINEQLLAPAGIAPTSCQPANASTATLAYDATNLANPGVLFQLAGTNAEACAGHRGLFLSALELVRWQAHLAHGTVVSKEVRTLMDTGKLGWQPWSNTTGRLGIYGHDGDGFNSARTHQVHTCVMKFPGKVEASLVINSSNLSGQSECTVLLNAYRAATS